MFRAARIMLAGSAGPSQISERLRGVHAAMSGHETIQARGLAISLITHAEYEDYVSLTDIARYRSLAPKTTIQNWLRNRDVVEFLGLRESLHNPRFKGIEFDAFKREAGRNAFVLSPSQWIERTGAVGMVSRPGRGGEEEGFRCGLPPAP